LCDVIVSPIVSVDWRANGGSSELPRVVRIIDQRRLPTEYVERDLRTTDDVVDAIRTLAVRGAPAIGVAGAMGLVAALSAAPTTRSVRERLAETAARIRGARPTAVNLPWAIDRMLRCAAAHADDASLLDALAIEATAIRDEDRAACAAIGSHGAALLGALRDQPGPLTVITHCNAGALATAGIGTALAPLYTLHAAGVPLDVYVDETRPLLQGARLSAWELSRAGIQVTVMPDGAAATVLRRAERPVVVIVGADRIARNGDVANKLGTYPLALAARAHGHRFVVCAPTSTLDSTSRSGTDIEIEERDGGEVTHLAGQQLAADGVAVFNPAFDVTPHALISHYVTDRGVVHPPFE
jgi:methylthioribose-1-phosphate isomerase